MEYLILDPTNEQKQALCVMLHEHKITTNTPILFYIKPPFHKLIIFGNLEDLTRELLFTASKI